MRNRRQSLQFIMFTAVSTYLVYTMVPAPSPSVWLALLWVVVLFSAMQSAFMDEKHRGGDPHGCDRIGGSDAFLLVFWPAAFGR